MTIDPARPLRLLVLALTAFGLLAVSTELTLLEHYEEATMLIPLGTNAVALAAVIAHLLVDSRATVRMLRVAMLLLVVTGALGVGLHYRGSLEFQIDMDPTLSAGELFWKVLHMKAPPTLAPGAIAQLGLLGLIATYRHPAMGRGFR